MENKKTCLHDKHVEAGALMQPFGGFDMPIQYTSIIDEHNAVRLHCGVFDVSHMGEITVTGNDAEKYVSHIFTNDIKDATIGKVYYGMMLYEDGGVVDDLLVYKMGENNFFLVTHSDFVYLHNKAPPDVLFLFSFLNISYDLRKEDSERMKTPSFHSK